MGRVEGKVAIVSGGASGIGRGCAMRLAEEGAQVVVSDVDQTMGEQTCSLIAEAGGEWLWNVRLIAGRSE